MLEVKVSELTVQEEVSQSLQKRQELELRALKKY